MTTTIRLTRLTTAAAHAACLVASSLLLTASLSAQDVLVPAKTTVTVLNGPTKIDSRKSDPKKQYPAVLAEPLVVDGKEVAPKGAPAALIVSETKGAGIKGRASITLMLASVTIDGKAVPVESEGVVSESDSQLGKTATGAGVGAAGGGLLGRALHGGTLTGVLIGAAAGATAAVVSGQHVQVDPETRLTFTLAADVVRP